MDALQELSEWHQQTYFAYFVGFLSKVLLQAAEQK